MTLLSLGWGKEGGGRVDGKEVPPSLISALAVYTYSYLPPALRSLLLLCSNNFNVVVPTFVQHFTLKAMTIPPDSDSTIRARFSPMATDGKNREGLKYLMFALCRGESVGV
jgi:hypothetical protein